MSHEIRTPLNAVIGMTELVLKGQLTAQQREFLSTVRDSGEALLSVINDILDFSKIEAEKFVLSAEKFHLRESLGDTMKSFAIPAHQQGLELVCHIHQDVPAWVVGDYHRLRQIVVNLVNNAIKFTQRGEVVLEVARERQHAENQGADRLKTCPAKGDRLETGLAAGGAANDVAIALHRYRYGDRHSRRKNTRPSSACSSRPTARPPGGMAGPGWAWPSPPAWSA